MSSPSPFYIFPNPHLPGLQNPALGQLASRASDLYTFYSSTKGDRIGWGVLHGLLEG